MVCVYNDVKSNVQSLVYHFGDPVQPCRINCSVRIQMISPAHGNPDGPDSRTVDLLKQFFGDRRVSPGGFEILHVGIWQVRVNSMYIQCVANVDAGAHLLHKT